MKVDVPSHPTGRAPQPEIVSAHDHRAYRWDAVPHRHMDDHAAFAAHSPGRDSGLYGLWRREAISPGVCIADGDSTPSVFETSLERAALSGVRAQ